MTPQLFTPSARRNHTGAASLNRRQSMWKLLAGGVALQLAASAPAQDRASSMSTQLVVTEEVQKPLTLSVDDLRAIGKQKEWVQLGTYGGVRLTDLLNLAGIRQDTPRALRRTYVVASATDGYQAVLSWGELYNAPGGKSVLVALDRDGVPLRDGEGRFALVAQADDRFGPRHVEWLSKIDVRQVPEVKN